MKAIISIIFIFLMPSLIFGQYGHDSGIIITKKLDTIYCHVPIQINYSGTILIKFPEDNSSEEINSEEIKYLATKYNVFENIKFIENKRETEQLMRFVVEGYVNLYLNSYLNTSSPVSGDGGAYSMYTAPTLEYVIKINDKTIFIKKNKFKETIIPIIEDAPELVNKVNSNKLKYEDIEEIIKEYNKIHTN